MKKILLFIISITLITNCLAQNRNLLKPQDIKKHFEKIIDQYYVTNNKLLNFCGRGCIFIKIQISKNSDSLDIALSKDSSAIVITTLKKALLKLQGDTDLTYFLKKTRRTIIIPFVYNYEAGCILPVQKDQEEANKLWLNYEFAMSNIYNTVIDMLSFTENRLDFLDCILLSPYITSIMQ